MDIFLVNCDYPNSHDLQNFNRSRIFTGHFLLSKFVMICKILIDHGYLLVIFYNPNFSWFAKLNILFWFDYLISNNLWILDELTSLGYLLKERLWNVYLVQNQASLGICSSGNFFG
jgi:hypothetical protein